MVVLSLGVGCWYVGRGEKLSLDQAIREISSGLDCVLKYKSASVEARYLLITLEADSGLPPLRINFYCTVS